MIQSGFAGVGKSPLGLSFIVKSKIKKTKFNSKIVATKYVTLCCIYQFGNNSKQKKLIQYIYINFVKMVIFKKASTNAEDYGDNNFMAIKKINKKKF
ncbi:hypothetical protein BpHYR1_051637 [Brachionus plicatilis]|uniref:Uncharacterized protein n=1 Tax=Brachionus plicatilis TaxID=10195 RepID=A0A3M7S0W6_BRAPC|nr:hypothetical protein BpHYR1_051637 [Brachionus plicatilis]